MESEIIFERVNELDVSALTKIMKTAFDEDTKRHLHRPCGGPPGYDNGEFIRKWFLESGADAYKLYVDDILIGGVNIFMSPDRKDKTLGCIFIDPAYEDKGYGIKIWRKIEAMYPDTVMWHTETPAFSKRNHHFYINKCGFKVVKIDNPKDEEEAQYIMEKEMQPR